MSSDPLTTLLAERPCRCPGCGHLLASAPDRRCVECGVPLEAALAIDEPARDIVPMILLCAGLSAAVGLERWLVYLARISDVLANLAAVPWGWLALDATLIASPVVGIIVLRYRRAIARLGRRTAMALAIAVLLPFLINLLSLA
jgi:hypothetical protein